MWQGSLSKRNQQWTLRIVIFWVEAPPFSQSRGTGVKKLKSYSWLLHRFSQNSFHFSAPDSQLYESIEPSSPATRAPVCCSRKCRARGTHHQTPASATAWAEPSAPGRNRRQDQHHITQTWKHPRQSIFLLFFSGQLTNNSQPSHWLAPRWWL